MVRSNSKKQIGFLKEKNRLVVGTSRQKRGLYIIGNAEFLKETSTFLWKVNSYIHNIVTYASSNMHTCKLLQPFIQKLENATGAAIPVKFEGKQYSCRSSAKLQTAACNPESLRYMSSTMCTRPLHQMILISHTDKTQKTTSNRIRWRLTVL